MKRKLFKLLWDFLGIPFRLVIFDQNWLSAFGWTTLEEERINASLPFIYGRLLDIGAGNNNLVKIYGNGIGVDIFDWGAGSIIVNKTSELPFRNESFDTITFLACLNHIPYRQDVLIEATRLLRPGGKVIITMINPILGNFGHFIWWYAEDRKRGGMKDGEVGGMWSSDIIELGNKSNLTLIQHSRFVYGMNNLYVFKAT